MNTSHECSSTSKWTAKTRAAVSATPAEAFFDNGYVDEIKQSAFYKELWS